MEQNQDVLVVKIKFSKNGKLYSYLCNDNVEVGDDVYVKGKSTPYKAIEVEYVKVCDLPVSIERMNYVTKEKDEDGDLEELIKNNTILREIISDVKLIGRDNELLELYININKKRMKNMVIIGDAGCGKTTLISGFGNMIKKDYYILGFSVGELISGTMFRGMLEQKLTNIFNSVIEFNKTHKKKIILFIDEIHMIVSNAGCDDAVSIHDMMKAYLTDPNVICLGATTVKEFNSSIRLDKAMMRRMTPLYISNLNDDAVIKIIQDFSCNSVDYELLDFIVKKSKEIPNSTNPDISIEITDRVVTRSNILHEPVTTKMILDTVENLKQSQIALKEEGE